MLICTTLFNYRHAVICSRSASPPFRTQSTSALHPDPFSYASLPSSSRNQLAMDDGNLREGREMDQNMGNGVTDEKVSCDCSSFFFFFSTNSFAEIDSFHSLFSL